MEFHRSPAGVKEQAELVQEMIHSTKAALDPHGIMNLGKIFRCRRPGALGGRSGLGPAPTLYSAGFYKAAPPSIATSDPVM